MNVICVTDFTSQDVGKWRPNLRSPVEIPLMGPMVVLCRSPGPMWFNAIQYSFIWWNDSFTTVI